MERRPGHVGNNETRMTICAIKAKHWVLRHYLWVALTLLVVALAAALLLHPDKVEHWLAIIAVPAVFVVTMQKQKTEELQLFKSLFTEFNSRYDELNDQLNAIRDEASEKDLEKKERDMLFDYFNLCGEEYLFFKQGYIYPEVWRAWYNGMNIFRQNERIKRLWDRELKTGSYYGLNFNDEKTAEQDVQSPTRDTMMTGTKVLAAT
jgi:hypothetical protein